MQYLAVTLALAPVVSAVDIRFYGPHAQSCDNASFGCANYSPNRCCSITGYASRVGWHAVPREWDFRLYYGPRDHCAWYSEAVGSLTDYCRQVVGLPAIGDDISGAGYTFNNGPPNKARELDSSQCQVQRADTFFAADGTKYDITALDDAQLKEMMELVGNSSSLVNYLEIFPGITLRK